MVVLSQKDTHVCARAHTHRHAHTRTCGWVHTPQVPQDLWVSSISALYCCPDGEESSKGWSQV